MSEQSLDVYLHERLTGTLVQEKTGHLCFTYNPDYVTDQTALPLSFSLPLRPDVFLDSVARPFFSGLLPDDLVRSHLARALGLSEKNSFALLAAVGGECAGAIALYPTGKTFPLKSSDPPLVLNEGSLQEKIRLLRRSPFLADQGDWRLSLAGAQDKLPVGLVDGKIALLKDGSPTSHILKPFIEDIEDSAHNEFFCLSLASRMGFSSARACLKFAQKAPFLLIERYDRVLQNGRLVRLHQEDFCQALSIAPEKKYQREGGPSIEGCLSLLESASAQPAADKRQFLLLLIFNYLIGNADCHGKNFSLLYKENRPRLAPAYDLLCTAVYPGIQKKLAMKIGGEYEPENIFKRHWYRLVPDTSVARRSIDKDLVRLATTIVPQARGLIEEFKTNSISSPLFEKIYKIIEGRSRQILVFS